MIEAIEYEVKYSGALERTGQCPSLSSYLGVSQLAVCKQERRATRYVAHAAADLSEREWRQKQAHAARRHKARQMAAARRAALPPAWSVRDRLSRGFSITAVARQFGITTGAVRMLGGLA